MNHWFRWCCLFGVGFLSTAWIWSCSGGSAGCKSNGDCLNGQYCATDGVCRGECSSKDDCKAGETCTAQKCVSSGTEKTAEDPAGQENTTGQESTTSSESVSEGGDGGVVESAQDDSIIPGKSPKCPTESRECYTGAAGTQGKGACKAGKQRCTDGNWGPCLGEVTPQPERCNGIDDDCDGQIDGNCTSWALSIGGKDGDEGNYVAVDKTGNVYATGAFHGKVVIGTTTLLSQGETDTYVAKIDTKGQPVWAVGFGGTGYDGGTAVAVDPSGNVYVGGYFAGTVVWDSKTLSSQGSQSIFIAKLDSQGKLVWATTAGSGRGEISVNSMAVDKDGNAHITGSFAERASFGSIDIAAKKLLDMYVARVTPDGTFQWVSTGGGSETDEGMSITIDQAGNTYVTGYFQWTAQFGETILSSGTYTNAFVAKLDNQGKFVWANQTRNSVHAKGTGIAVDAAGNIYLTGYFEQQATFGSKAITSTLYTDIFAAKLDPKGLFLWAISASTYFGSAGTGIGQDSTGNFYIVGSFAGPVAFGASTVNGRGDGSDAYVVRFTPEGQWKGAVAVGGQETDEGKCIAVDNLGNAYITGTFRQTASFLTSTLSSQGYSDAFVAQVQIK